MATIKSIEEKAKAYDEAIEKLRGLLEGIHEEKCDIMEEDIIKIFPELKESEDEKIRKYLIDVVNEYCKGSGHDGCIAWLKKQGEQNPAKNIIETWKDVRLEVYQQASGNRHEPNYSDDTTKMFSLNDIDEIIEKMSEQKPFNYEKAHIQQNDFAPKSALEAAKEEKVDNQNCVKPADKVEAKFHEGDWVVYDGWICQIIDVTEDGYCNSQHGFIPKNREDSMRLWTIKDAKDGDVLTDGKPFIFKKIDTNKYCYAYCGISVDDGFRIKSEGKLGEWTWMQDIKPATKEQRDTLLKTMADAGYTFDFEKKELKKIEQEPAWSEEDERIRKAIIECFAGSHSSMYPYKGFTRKQILAWLKSLKDRCVWKPSDEQMEANAIDVEVRIDAGGYPYIPIIELYDYDKDVPLAKKGERYKVVLIKEG